MHYCRDKQIDRMIAGLVRDGWQFSRGRHGKLRHPTGRGFVTVPCTPGDHRAFLNLRRDIGRLAATE